MDTVNDWRAGAEVTVMQLRARMLQKLRAFFARHEVLEVETPLLNRHAVTDVHIDSLPVALDQSAAWLHTSPEYAMKRLLAAGSGPIYQVCKVFRAGEAGRRHNPEFSMLEWYRPGFDHHALMTEVDTLVRELLGEHSALGPTLKLSYRQLFQQYTELDPFTATLAELQQCAQQASIDMAGDTMLSQTGWLDLLLTHMVEPQLPVQQPVFIYDYPPEQAALARLQEVDDQTVACRFELYLDGLELANGYYELLDPEEQRRRFQQDQRQRREQGRTVPEMDEKFLAALAQGLSDCAGVALGLDRLLMIAAGKDDIRDVLSFSYDRL